MKSKLFLLSCVALLAIFLMGGCTPKKAVKKTLDDTGTKSSAVASGDLETDDGDMDGSTISPEGSSRGIDFTEVVNISLDDIYFGVDQYNLSQSALNILAKNVETLKSNPKIIVQVEGHADERGTVEYNLALGQKRAAVVRNYLVAAGIDSGRVFTISYGKERPLDPEHNEEAWDKNRRAHLVPAAK